MGVRLPLIKSMDDIISITEDFGFLPFFQNEIEGFSIEDACPNMWSLPEGPWEWKGPIIRKGKSVYGKLFKGKAGYINISWLPDFANYRRDGYDFDSRYDDGKAQYKDKGIYEAILASGSCHTKDLKSALGYGKDGAKGFETVMTRLQMQTYVVIEDFDYMTDKNGKRYGWGVARWSTPEHVYGKEFVRSGYSCNPLESKERIIRHLSQKLKNESVTSIEKLIK